MTQIIIAMPDNERRSFLAAMTTIQDQANTYTDQCVKILVDEYGAAEAGVERDIFYLAAVYHLAQGNPLPEPGEAVKEAIGMYKAKCLGMEA